MVGVDDMRTSAVKIAGERSIFQPPSYSANTVLSSNCLASNCRGIAANFRNFDTQIKLRSVAYAVDPMASTALGCTRTVVPKKLKKLRPVSQLPSEPHAQSTWALGKSFESSALQLLQNRNSEAFLPTLYLLLHALELYLKAFLLSQGASDKTLRSVSHDLVGCMRICGAHGLATYLNLPWTAIVQIVRVNRYYSDKELEYFSPRAKNFGNIEALADTVHQVAKHVLKPITAETFRSLSSESLSDWRF
jgi:hypothetical protein